MYCGIYDTKIQSGMRKIQGMKLRDRGSVH